MRRLAIGVLAVAMLLPARGVGADPASARWPVCGEWRGPFPLPVADGFVLEDVAVVSAHEAWAVGGVGAEFTWNPLVLHWNDVRWERVAFPKRSGRSGLGYLSDLAVGAGETWVVGAKDVGPTGMRPARPFTARWNGEAWHVVPLGIAWQGSVGLSAVEPSLRTHGLWAVGAVRRHHRDRTVVLRWSGSSWHRAGGVRAGVFTDVAASGGTVWAVGYEVRNAGPRMVASRWRRGKWAVRSGPSGVTDASVDALPNGSFTAVGGNAIVRLAPGGTIVRRLSRGLDLRAVVLSSTTDAWAVGGRFMRSPVTPVLARRHGGRWAIGPAPGGTGYLAAIDGTPHNLWLAHGRTHRGGIGSTFEIYHRC